jgi:hypothetical protein
MDRQVDQNHFQQAAERTGGARFGTLPCGLPVSAYCINSSVEMRVGSGWERGIRFSAAGHKNITLTNA